MAKGDGTAPDYDWRFWVEWDSEKDDYVPKGGGSVVAAIFMEIALPIIPIHFLWTLAHVTYIDILMI